jgi:hypothetical protein
MSPPWLLAEARKTLGGWQSYCSPGWGTKGTLASPVDTVTVAGAVVGLVAWMTGAFEGGGGMVGYTTAVTAAYLVELPAAAPTPTFFGVVSVTVVAIMFDSAFVWRLLAWPTMAIVAIGSVIL